MDLRSKCYASYFYGTPRCIRFKHFTREFDFRRFGARRVGKHCSEISNDNKVKMLNYCTNENRTNRYWKINNCENFFDFQTDI